MRNAKHRSRSHQSAISNQQRACRHIGISDRVRRVLYSAFRIPHSAFRSRVLYSAFRIPHSAFQSVLLVLLLASPGFCWETLHSDHAEILFQDRYRVAAEKVAMMTETAYLTVTDALGLEPAGGVRVYLSASEEDFEVLTRGMIPEWGVACAFPARATVVLRYPIRGDRRLEEILTHEMTHVVLGGALGTYRPPRWFDEGLAVWLSGEWKLRQTVNISWAVLTRNVIPLREIDHVLSFPSSKARQAYTESSLAVEYLVQVGGMEALSEVVRWMASGTTFDGALRAAIGHSHTEFERGWGAYLRKRFGLISLLWERTNVWVLILALSVIAYIAIKLRNRKILKEWEEEEEEMYLEEPEEEEEDNLLPYV